MDSPREKGSTLTLTARHMPLEHFAAGTIDLLVIGGGIVGAGVARDAAMRGLRVALVDRFDFAFGSSSRSTRLLHGGLRYLAQGHLRLVREASLEKQVIQRIAPHLTLPLAFMFPTRAGSPWKHWKLHLGVNLYDLLCSGRNFGKSSGLATRETLQVVPGLSSDRLTGAVRYFDALTSDARLVLDTLRSAERHGAKLRNYCGLKDAQLNSDGWTCELQDEAGDRAEMTARVVVNAAGAWASQMPASRTLLRLTKGVHLVIDRSRLPVAEAIVLTEGSRILFAIPWGQRVILGTTDTDYSGDPATPGCDAEDVEYILNVVNSNFPEANLTIYDLISVWSGLRPLLADKNGAPSDISRRHQISMTQRGWFDVAGGKLTTYRLMAEQVVDRICHILKHHPAECRTAVEPLLPDGKSIRFSGVLPPEISREAVEHFCREEWAVHLDDVMIRRSNWRHYHPDHLEIASTVAGWMGECLGWTQEQRHIELAGYAVRTKAELEHAP